jgi:hypothetical protein
VAGSDAELIGEMHLWTSHPDLPRGLVARLRRGAVLREDRIDAARDRLRRGEHPAPDELADAVVDEGVLVGR